MLNEIKSVLNQPSSLRPDVRIYGILDALKEIHLIAGGKEFEIKISPGYSFCEIEDKRVKNKYLVSAVVQMLSPPQIKLLQLKKVHRISRHSIKSGTASLTKEAEEITKKYLQRKHDEAVFLLLQLLIRDIPQFPAFLRLILACKDKDAQRELLDIPSGEKKLRWIIKYRCSEEDLRLCVDDVLEKITQARIIPAKPEINSIVENLRKGEAFNLIKGVSILWIQETLVMELKPAFFKKIIRVDPDVFNLAKKTRILELRDEVAAILQEEGFKGESVVFNWATFDTICGFLKDARMFHDGTVNIPKLYSTIPSLDQLVGKKRVITWETFIDALARGYDEILKEYSIKERIPVKLLREKVCARLGVSLHAFNNGIRILQVTNPDSVIFTSAPAIYAGVSISEAERANISIRNFELVLPSERFPEG